ncbi:Stp1/IreP family PP2C-type Ser/Thr phosphatase [Periweissella cryptocerci]|uniref:Stp1/IreP family PP2C-type Ser/Thr phosphatase n=1 Tax=Periweissella cryptocerci TaxID=2506420 RepID=A0A4P6YRM8_9LACO|nr:Stp1/IreP family PP2C-type Ser/Thr phosphatase [Periweissella cryptocerci]QBO35276.1 Stp1/IreP family PP2C-type Ser/Thr phosphatase [Periweissella cryptocerci]
MKVAFQSDIGTIRETNQDFVGTFKNQKGYKFAVVADGVGGQAAGDVASTMAVLHLGNQWELTEIASSAEAKTWLMDQVLAENAAILEASQRFRDLQGMATTLVSAMIFEDEVLMANIGDSRGYLLHDGTFRQLTTDHSLVNQLVQEGKIAPEDARLHPDKNVITRWLGVNDEAVLDTSTYATYPGDIILLATDGLTNLVTDAQISVILMSQMTLEEKVEELILKANQAGGRDNITVLLMERGEEVRAQ